MNVFIPLQQLSREMEKRLKESCSGHYTPKKIYFSVEEDTNVEWQDRQDIVPPAPKSSIGKNLLEGGRCLLQIIFVLVCLSIFVWLFML